MGGGVSASGTEATMFSGRFWEPFSGGSHTSSLPLLFVSSRILRLACRLAPRSDDKTVIWGNTVLLSCLRHRSTSGQSGESLPFPLPLCLFNPPHGEFQAPSDIKAKPIYCRHRKANRKTFVYFSRLGKHGMLMSTGTVAISSSRNVMR